LISAKEQKFRATESVAAWAREWSSRALREPSVLLEEMRD